MKASDVLLRSIWLKVFFMPGGVLAKPAVYAGRPAYSEATSLPSTTGNILGRHRSQVDSEHVTDCYVARLRL